MGDVPFGHQAFEHPLDHRLIAVTDCEHQIVDAHGRGIADAGEHVIFGHGRRPSPI